MSALNVLSVAVVVFVLIRAVCEPKLRPGREIWNRVLGLEPVDVAVLAGVRFVGTFSLLVGLGAGIGLILTWWVESLDLVAMGSVAGQEAVDRVERLLAFFATGKLALSRLSVLVSIFYLVLLAVGMLFWLMRSARGVTEQINVAIEEFRKLAVANKLPYIPPDERMRQVNKAIAAAHIANAEGDVIEALYTRSFQYDVVRRLDPKLLREVGEPMPGPRVAGVLRFLISSPLSHQAKRAGRIVSALAMVALVPAALVVASADLNKAVDEKRLALEAVLTLEVDLSRETPREERSGSSEERDQPKTEGEQDEKDEEEWCEAVGAALPADACVAAAEFGTAFEAAWGAGLLDQSGAPARAEVAGISDARRAWARRQVLLESVAPRTATVNVAEAASGTSDRQVWPRTVMAADLEARTGSGPVTNFGKLAGNIFGRLAQSVSEPVAVEVADRPLTLRELAATAASAGVGLLIDNVGFGGVEPTLTKELLSGAFKETLGKLAEEEVRRPEVVKRLRRSAELAAMDAALRVRDAKRAVGEPMGMVKVFIDPDLARSFKRTIDQATRLEFLNRDVPQAQASVSLEAVSSSNVDWDKDKNALRQYKAATGNVNLDSSTAPLASYSSVFPGIEGQRAQTEEARIARVLDPDGAKVLYGGPPDTVGEKGLKIVKATEMTRIAKDRLDLARSFPRLRAYHRVGGVLVGREPDGAEDLDLVGVDFSVDKDSLTLHLTHADGTKTAVGPYDPAVAHLALAYAADGRPVTVTIVSAPPLADRKILLHPALVDTEVGCHAIRLDLFINRFGREWLLDVRRYAEAVRRQIVVRLYGLAWGARFSEWLVVAKSAMGERGARLSDEERQQQIEQELIAPTKSKTFDTVPSDVDELLIPLRQRPSLFDPKLVEILEACLVKTEKDSDIAPKQCVERRARQAGRTWGGSPENLLFGGVSRIVPISGVREEAYELDEELRFAQVPRDIWSGPLRFVVLDSIVMIRYGEAKLIESAGETEPWEFEAIQELLEETVLNAVRVKPEALQTLRVMQQFTVAQRLFRAAFEGRLGERFPVERLVEIIRETAAHVDFNAVKTDQWLLGDRDPDGPAMQLREALGVQTVQQATCFGSSEAEPPWVPGG